MERGDVRSDKIYSVTEITRLIKKQLEQSFSLLWIEGEVSNFHRHHSGHLYFTLKDENCQIRAVMFRSDAKKLSFELVDGLQVICRGRINVYEPRGEYQIMADLVEPKGKGALQMAFEQLKEKLSKEGLFDPAVKKKVPLLPKRVGVVTSPRGAAIVDILRTLERRFGRTHILIYPAKVQGEGASREIVEGIEYLGRQPEMDVIIVGRGGGSIEDLWAFNEEIVARAIFRCPVPIISAVGHEVDFTIADFVADIRASTPSAAAEMVVDKEQSFFDKIENLEKRLTHQLQYSLQSKKQDVLRLVHHQAFQNFKIRLLNLEQKADDLETRAWNALRNLRQGIVERKSRAALLEEKLINGMKRKLQSLMGVWEKLSAELSGLSPLNILKKGYTLCWKKSDRGLVKSIEQVRTQEELMVSFFTGEFTCVVRKVDREKPIASRMRDDE